MYGLDASAFLSVLTVGTISSVDNFETAAFGMAFERHWVNDSSILGVHHEPEHVLVDVMMWLLAGQVVACLCVSLLMLKVTFRSRMLGFFRACASLVFLAGLVQFGLLTCLDSIEVGASEGADSCPRCAFVTTCSFLYTSMLVLGLGVGSTYALGVSFLCGVTKRTLKHGKAMHRLGSLSLCFLMADFAGFVAAYAYKDQAWLFILAMGKIAATLPVIIFPKFLEDYAELSAFKQLDATEKKRRLNGGNGLHWRDLYLNRKFGVNLIRATALIVFLNLTPLVSQSVTSKIFHVLNVHEGWVQRYGFASHFLAVVAGFLSQALSHFEFFESPRNRLFMLVGFAVCNGLLAVVVAAWDVSAIPTTQNIGIVFMLQRIVGAMSTETVFEILPYAFSKPTFPLGFSTALTFRSLLHLGILAAVHGFDVELTQNRRVMLFIILAVIQVLLVSIMVALSEGIPKKPDEGLQHDDDQEPILERVTEDGDERETEEGNE